MLVNLRREWFDSRCYWLERGNTIRNGGGLDVYIPVEVVIDPWGKRAPCWVNVLVKREQVISRAMRHRNCCCRRRST